MTAQQPMAEPPAITVRRMDFRFGGETPTQFVDGGYWNRVLTMLEITLPFWLDTITTTANFLRARGENKPGSWFRGIGFLLGRPGPLRRLIPAYLAWFRPDFHPWQHDNRALIRPWQQKLSNAN